MIDGSIVDTSPRASSSRTIFVRPCMYMIRGINALQTLGVLPFPSSNHPPLLLPSPHFSIHSPLIQLGGCKLSQWVPVEPANQTNFGAFWGKK